MYRTVDARTRFVLANEAPRGAGAAAKTAAGPALKKQRRWSFTLDDGLTLEGVPLTKAGEMVVPPPVPLKHSGVSNLLDDLELKPIAAH